MGIKNFTKFMNENFTEWDTLDRDYQFLIIDGNSACCQLYMDYHTWTLGGEYKDFYITTSYFFYKLNGMKPMVIFDGVDDLSKMDVVCEHRTGANKTMKKKQKEMCSLYGENNGPLQPFKIFSVFKEVLESFDIKYRVANGDADEEIAAFANYYKCPVLASDSDYFMFELNYGYIPLDRFMTNSKRPLYHVRKFEEQFSLKSPELRLAIPALYGNDFIKGPKNGDHDFKATLKSLSKCDTCEQYFAEAGYKDAGDVYENLEKAGEQYCDFKMPADYDPQGNTPASSEVFTDVPDWAIDRFRKGHFEPQLLNVYKNRLYVFPTVVEDIKQSSAWLISRHIRQYFYGFMDIPTEAKVTELIRIDFSHEIDRIEVGCTNLTPEASIFSNFPNVAEERQDIVLSVLKCHKIISYDHIAACFSRLDDQWKLPIAATIYWHQTCKNLQEHQIKSLLLSFLICSNQVKEAVSPSEMVTQESQPEYLKSLHAFAQWQCVYHDAMSLNYLAKEPFPTTSLSSLYSGRVAMSYAIQGHKVDSVSLRNTEQELYNKFLYLVTGCGDPFLLNSGSETTSHGQKVDSVPLRNTEQEFLVTECSDNTSPSSLNCGSEAASHGHKVDSVPLRNTEREFLVTECSDSSPPLYSSVVASHSRKVDSCVPHRITEWKLCNKQFFYLVTESGERIGQHFKKSRVKTRKRHCGRSKTRIKEKDAEMEDKYQVRFRAKYTAKMKKKEFTGLGQVMQSRKHKQKKRRKESADSLLGYYHKNEYTYDDFVD